MDNVKRYSSAAILLICASFITTVHSKTVATYEDLPYLCQYCRPGVMESPSQAISPSASYDASYSSSQAPSYGASSSSSQAPSYGASSSSSQAPSYGGASSASDDYYGASSPPSFASGSVSKSSSSYAPASSPMGSTYSQGSTTSSSYASAPGPGSGSTQTSSSGASDATVTAQSPSSSTSSGQAAAPTSQSGGGGGSGGKKWCIPKLGVKKTVLMKIIVSGCKEAGIDCEPLDELKGLCHHPNNPHKHASFVMNAIYQSKGKDDAACDFGGIGRVTTDDPSHDTCVFPG